MKRKKKLSIERNRKKVVWLFMLPWIIGVIYFFILPFINTIIYSFSNVFISPDEVGLQTEWIGKYNYDYILFTDAKFIRTVGTSISDLIYTVPVILIFSIFIAILLNQKFIGRSFVRSIFFVPVIIASGVVIQIITDDVFAQTASSDNTSFFQTGMIEEILLRSGLPEKIVNMVIGVTSSVFDLSWKSGVQILLFISALQGIPESHYEAASIEGANAWECFWKITFPALLPTCLLVVIYTVIDSFTDVSNPVMKDILERFDSFYYGIASASAILYFAVVIVCILLLAVIFTLPGREKRR